jgi:hypothetical protein
VNWRIYSLIQSGLLSRIGRGKYSLGTGKIFHPTISEKMRTMHKKIKGQFPYLEICIWNTSALNEFMTHQPGRFYTLVEVDKESMESVFYFLKEKFKNVFLNPSSEVINLYTTETHEIIIIRNLVSEAPIQIVQDVPTTTIEKLLVDIFSDEILFAAQQGSERKQIFEEAFGKYTVNESKMLRYANRKRKKEYLVNFLNSISKYRQQLTNAAVL